MSILIGLELELFNLLPMMDKIIIPERNLPVDGCGAIVEFRSKPYADVYDATFEIHKLIKKETDKSDRFSPVSLDPVKYNRHKFTQEEWRQACKQSNKDYSITPQNIYGYKPRLLPRSTVAVSLQLNFSNQLAAAYSSKERDYPAAYGMLDTHQLIQTLDREFKKEIEEANRIPGEYAIKDNGIRLEYRSLPANVFFEKNLELRIKNVVNSLKG